jgi:hypothetical protein
MFGPKHTLESVAKALTDGLEKGTIALHPEEPTEADVENFESMAIKSLAKAQYRLVAHLIVGNLFLIMGLTVLTERDVFDLISQPEAAGLRAIWVFSLVICVLGTVSGFVLVLRSQKRSVELKTFIRILKMADATTAKRLVLWEGSRLRGKALIP